MKRMLWILTVAVLVIGGAAGTYAEEQSLSSVVGAVELQSITATVIGINAKERLVTLKGPEGDTLDIKADERVRNFDQIKTGDKLNIDYIASVAVSLADPSEKPTKTTVSNVEVAEKGAKPSVRTVDVVDVVGTILKVNKKDRTITVQGPEGKVVTLDVNEQIKDVDSLKAGGKIRARFTVATAVAITKP